MRKVALLCSLLPVVWACGDRKAPFTGEFDSGIVCAEKQKLIRGECKTFCARNADCPQGEVCDILTGACGAPDISQTDGGQVVLAPCIAGGIRCNGDRSAVEACQQDGTWVATQTCGGPNLCQNERCLACQPSVTSCDSADRSYVNVCSSDGLDAGRVTCAAGAQCILGGCRQCSPPATRCSDAGVPQSCERVADPAAEFQFVSVGDNFDGTCITGQCTPPQGSNPAQCVAPACSPGTAQCKPLPDGGLFLEECTAQGQIQPKLCTAQEECIGGTCLNECAIAESASAYFGCEYWAAVLDNSVDVSFKGNTSSGQQAVAGTSEFAIVVTNQSDRSASVTVYRSFGGSEQVVKTVTVEPRTGPNRGLLTIRLPWQSISPNAARETSVTGIARYGYRITSTKPISAYMFNPLTPVLGGVDSNTNDASLLLPTHILGTSYVALAPETLHFRNTNGLIGNSEMNTYVTIVATQNATQVKVKSTAKTLAGTGVTAFAKGETRTITLQRYDVLQLSTTGEGETEYETCPNSPYPTPPGDKLCRVNNDLTGTVITSNKPIAVFSGAPCTLRPYNKTACDHVEEQMFPFNTWGTQFVAQQSAYLTLSGGGFADGGLIGADHWKIVAGCPQTSTDGGTVCPLGTKIEISPLPLDAGVLSGGGCIAGTSLTSVASPCRLNAGGFVEFVSRQPNGRPQNFVITADAPIAVAQFFTGQNNSGTSGNAPIQGDPSMVFLPPLQQWRSNYTVLSAPSMANNYLGLAADSTQVDQIIIDRNKASQVTINVSSMQAIPGSDIRVTNRSVASGTHTVEVVAKPGVTVIPGVGVTVYGFDDYVSYGYTGGLNLQTIVSGINPGG